MAQTLFGSGGFRGCADEGSSGLYISSINMEATEDTVEVLNHAGEVIGISLGNENSTITANGVTTTAGTQGQTLGSTMGAIANSAIYGTDTGVTVYYITNVTLERQNQAWETGSFTARGWVGLTDTTPG